MKFWKILKFWQILKFWKILKFCQILKFSRFRVGATFEMRTALYGILLLIVRLKIHNWVFISRQFVQGESKTAERQKERECERQCVARNERWRR